MLLRNTPPKSLQYEQVGFESISTKEEPKQAVELRFTPWDWEFSMYFSLAYLAQGKTEETVEFDRRLRVIGDSAYRTSSLLTSKGKPGQVLQGEWAVYIYSTAAFQLEQDFWSVQLNKILQ